MESTDINAVVDILDKWNMAPIPVSADNPDPERDGINIESSFAATDGERIVGVFSYIIHNDELVETASLAVDPEYKGKGIGLQLQQARLSEMRQKGYKRVRTETDWQSTIDWYIQKFAYRVIETNPKKHNFGLADVDHWTV